MAKVAAQAPSMDRARAIASLEVWREVTLSEGGRESGEGAEKDPVAPAPASRLSELFAVHELPQADTEARRTAVFTVVSQVIDSFGNMACSTVDLRVALLPGPAGPAPLRRHLRIEVPGYDVERSGPFSQLVVGSGCRGLLLVAPRCCAAVALPDLSAEATGDGDILDVRAVPLVPPDEASFLKVLWHPLSDAHVGALLSDGSWQLLNLAYRASVADPEVHLKVTFGSAAEAEQRAVDFTFGAPGSGSAGGIAGADGGLAGAGEAAWLAMAVVFLSSSGRLSFISPVLPSTASLPALAIDALRTAVVAEEALTTEWLRRTALRGCAGAGAPGACGAAAAAARRVRHDLHLHGSGEAYHRRWRPVEQAMAEEPRPDGGDSSPRSPRHQRSSSSYCSVQLVVHSPVVVIARGTAAGVVDFLILDGSLGPRFVQRGADAIAGPTCFVFEEVDLVLPPSLAPALALSAWPASSPGGGGAPGAAVVLVRSRSLLAAIELPWLGVLRQGSGDAVATLPPAIVTTLAEARPSDGRGESLGWQALPPAGLLLRSKAAASVTADAAAGAGAALQVIDVPAALQAAAKARARTGKPGQGGEAAAPGPSALPAYGEASGASTEPRGEEFSRHLSAPVLLPAPLFGIGGTEPVSAAAVARGVAAVQAGQVSDLQARRLVLEHLTNEVPKMVSAVTAELGGARRAAESLRDEAASLSSKVDGVQERQANLEKMFKAVLEALAAELQLRGLNEVASAELPKLWAGLHELRQAFELLRAAAVAPVVSDAGGLAPQRLSTLGELQRAWTDVQAGHLRERACAAEAAVAAAARRVAEQRRLAEA